jgi:hypothetical protein
VKRKSPAAAPGIALAVTLAATMAAPVLAHHSLAGQFDVDKSVHISGTVSRIEWANPHVYIYVDVKEAGGAIGTWKLESLPVAMMRKAGLSKQELMADGKTVEIDAHPARNGTPRLGYMLFIQFPDGRHVQFSKVPGAEQTGGT